MILWGGGEVDIKRIELFQRQAPTSLIVYGFKFNHLPLL